MKQITYLLCLLFFSTLLNSQSFASIENYSLSLSSLSKIDGLQVTKSQKANVDIFVAGGIPCINLMYADAKIDPVFDDYMFSPSITKAEEILRMKAYEGLVNTLPDNLALYRKNTKLLELFKNDGVSDLVKNLEDIQNSYSNLTKSQLQARLFEDLLEEIDLQDGLLNFILSDPAVVTLKLEIYEKIIHAPWQVRQNPSFINTVIDSYLNPYSSSMDKLIIPQYPAIVGDWINELQKIKPGNIVPYPGTGAGTSIPFKPEYVNSEIDLTPFSVEGAHKFPHYLTNETQYVLLRLRNDTETALDFEKLRIEINSLDGLSNIQSSSGDLLPVAEVLGITNHLGTPSMISKYYEFGSVRYKFSGYGFNTNADAFLVELVDNNVLEEFYKIRQNLVENGVDIVDLQFLVDVNKKPVISDPQGFTIGNNFTEIEEIDALLNELVRRRIQDSNITGPIKINDPNSDDILNDILDNKISVDYLNLFISKGIEKLVIEQSGDFVTFTW